MSRLSRPLNRNAVKAADDEFYANHPEFVKDGKRIPLSDTDPSQAGLRKEWVELYKKYGGKEEDDTKKPLAKKPDGTKLPCAQCKVTLSPKDIKLSGIGKTKEVTATGTPGGGVYTYSGSDNSIATVAGSNNKGRITAVAQGKTVITVTYSPPGCGSCTDTVVIECKEDLKPCKFEAKLLSVTFESPIKVCREKKPVPTPHWKVGENVNDGPGSLRAAAYLIEGKGVDTVTVEIVVNESENCCGPAKLRGSISDQKGSGPLLEIEGDCPVNVGIHKVPAKIKQLPDKIKWYRGDMLWGLEVPDCKSLQFDSTRIEVFFILDTPMDFYQAKKGDWVEALRFLCEKVEVQDISKPEEAAAKITQYCFSSHGLSYDTNNGAPKYGVSRDGGAFQLDDYFKKTSTKCNCYDQAGAIQSLSAALGIKLTWLYLSPFGYLKKTDLIGVGQCNNPFFTSNGSTPIIGANDHKRTGFGNHAFCELISKIYDACAGPHKGTEMRTQYVDACIEKVTDTSLYHVAAGDRPGTSVDISVKSGINEVK